LLSFVLNNYLNHIFRYSLFLSNYVHTSKAILRYFESRCFAVSLFWAAPFWVALFWVALFCSALFCSCSVLQFRYFEPRRFGLRCFELRCFGSRCSEMRCFSDMPQNVPQMMRISCDKIAGSHRLVNSYFLQNFSRDWKIFVASHSFHLFRSYLLRKIAILTFLW